MTIDDPYWKVHSDGYSEFDADGMTLAAAPGSARAKTAATRMVSKIAQRVESLRAEADYLEERRQQIVRAELS